MCSDQNKKLILRFHWNYEFWGRMITKKWFLENGCMPVARSSISTTEFILDKFRPIIRYGSTCGHQKLFGNI